MTIGNACTCSTLAVNGPSFLHQLLRVRHGTLICSKWVTVDAHILVTDIFTSIIAQIACSVNFLASLSRYSINNMGSMKGHVVNVFHKRNILMWVTR